MKIFTMPALAIVLSGFFSLAQSTLGASCQSPSLAPVTSDGSLYRFRISSYCQINRPAPVDRLKQTYYQYYQGTSGYQIHRVRQGISQGGLTGLGIEMTETVGTDHGQLVIDQDVFLGDNQRDTFLAKSLSTAVEGDGDTKYTKMVNHLVRLTGGQVYIEKEIKVKKPWFAPESMFINTVKENLQSDMLDLQSHHSSLLQ